MKEPVHKNNAPRRLLMTAILLVIVGALAFILYQRSGKPDDNRQKPVNTVNYDPPTKQEKTETDAFKDAQGNAASPTPANPTEQNGKKQVTPVISYIGQYDASIEASGLVPSTVENGGICTLAMQNGAAKITKTSTASADASSTTCGALNFAATELRPKGTWTATLTYESPSIKGVSATSKFEVK